MSDPAQEVAREVPSGDDPTGDATPATSAAAAADASTAAATPTPTPTAAAAAAASAATSTAAAVDETPLDDETPDPAAPGHAGRGLRHAFRALGHRDFALFWSGALVSNVGTWMQNITVPFVLYEITGSASWVGFAAFAQLFPMMAMGSVGGVLADRFSRKNILLVTQSLQMALALLLWAVWSSGSAGPGAIAAIVAMVGTVAGVQLAAWQSFVPQLVPREDLLNAVTLNSTQFNGARAIGPALGGVVLATWGAGAAFFLNGASYLVVLAALAAVRAEGPALPRSGRRMAGQFKDGLTYVKERPGLGLAVFMVGVAGLLGAPIVQFTPVFARDVFEVGEAAYGALTAALGTGAILGAVLLGGWGDGFRRSRLAVFGLLVYGAFEALMGVAPAYWVALVALFAMGIAYLVLASALNTSIQMIVDEEYRGRVMAIYLMAFTGGYPLGALIQGRIADAVGVQGTVAVSGLLLVLVAVGVALRPHLVNEMDSEADPDVDPRVAAVAG